MNWLDKEKERTLELKRGDVFRLRYGTVFHLHCNLERDEVPDKLRVYAIFDVGKCLSDQCLGAYSSIRDLLWGFDEKTLRSAFAVCGLGFYSRNEFLRLVLFTLCVVSYNERFLRTFLEG